MEKNHLILKMIFIALFLGCGEFVYAKINVVTTLFPFYDFVIQIGQDKVDVELLLPPGVEAHSYSPTPKDILKIKKAELFIYTGKVMEPWVGDLLEGIDHQQLMVMDASQGEPSLIPDQDHHHHSKVEHNHQGADPHIWLDPVKVRQIVNHITKMLIAKDPDHQPFYSENGETLLQSLESLELETRQVINNCNKKIIVFAGHNIFNYYGNYYGIEFINAYPNFSPNARPTPKSLTKLIKIIKKNKITTIYHEALIEPKVGRVLASETGANLLMLHGAHNLSKTEWKQGLTYIAIMKNNLEKLKLGLEYRQP